MFALSAFFLLGLVLFLAFRVLRAWQPTSRFNIGDYIIGDYILLVLILLLAGLVMLWAESLLLGQPVPTCPNQL